MEVLGNRLQWRATLLVVLACGCDRLYSAGGPPRHDAPVDTAPPELPCSPMRLVGPLPTTPGTSSWWDLGTSVASVATAASGVAVHVASGPGAGSVSFNGTTYLDLRGDAISLGVATSAAIAADAVVELSIIATGEQDRLVIRRLGSHISFGYDESGIPTDVSTVPYDGARDRFWRIASTRGVTTWETSADGATFEVRAMRDDLRWVGLMRPRVVINRGAGTTALDVTLDHLNGDAIGGAACPITQLSDTFDGPTLRPQWVVQRDLGTITVDGGLSEILPGGDTAMSLAALSATVFDLTGGTATVQLTSPMSHPGMTGHFALRTLDGQRADIEQTAAGLVARVDGGPSLGAFTGALPAWLRFRATAGTLSWETSTDGHVFAAFATSNQVVGLHHVRVELSASEAATQTTLDTIRFDNLDLPQ